MIKRFRAAISGLEENSYGKFVQYSDYMALREDRDRLAEDYAALKDERDRLAVEAGLMRKLLPDYISVPVTDASMAEIRAQAVEELAAWARSFGNGMGIDLTPDEIANYANNIRAAAKGEGVSK